jgi:uncharacterized cupredoxin-like copper-binding protein
MHHDRRRFLSGATTTAALVGSALVAPAIALAHTDGKSGDKTNGKAKALQREQKPWGIAGTLKDVTQTMPVRMLDTMRFEPSMLKIQEGETVRFVIRNAGNHMHEFVIGTPEENRRHAELMIKFPNMAHDEPYMAHVAAGKTGQIIWTFNRPGQFEFACLIAGHYQAGMRGTIEVVAKRVAPPPKSGGRP